MPIKCYCGDKVIADIFNPQPAEIDLDHIEFALRNIRRFSCHRYAIPVHDHRALVWQLAYDDMAPKEVVEWCWYHDDHEGIIGDIVNPVKAALRHPENRHDMMQRLEDGIDRAICMARRIALPDAATRLAVRRYDLQAATIEWTQIMGMEFDPAWCVDVSEISDATIRAGLQLGRNTR